MEIQMLLKILILFHMNQHSELLETQQKKTQQLDNPLITQ